MSNDLTVGLVPVLTSAGFRVIGVDFREAVRGAIQHKPDALIMPDIIDDPDSAIPIAELCGLDAMALIFVGKGDSGRRAEALLEGADAYLRFPVNSAILKSRLSSVLRARRVLTSIGKRIHCQSD